jgi:hypothetical protein
LNFDGSVWSLGENFTAATTTSGVAVDFSGANPVIYASAPSGIFSGIDTGSGGGALTLVPGTAPGANFAYRGLLLLPSAIPVPEPGSIAFAGLAAAGFGARLFRRKKTAG